AVFRAHKLAKYLPEYGWKPYVLTVDTNYLYNEDPELLGELPPEVEIVHARYIEPTIRGIRMALGGADRTFVTQKANLQKDLPTSQTQRDEPAKAMSRLGSVAYGYARRNWLHVPDAYRTWRRSA